MNLRNLGYLILAMQINKHVLQPKTAMTAARITMGKVGKVSDFVSISGELTGSFSEEGKGD